MPKPTKSSPALPGFNLQSTYANRFHVTIHGATVRIAFGKSIVGVDLLFDRPDYADQQCGRAGRGDSEVG